MVSIIVPVYNAERYLEKCVESVLKQTMKDYQLILVDDGSTDKSAALCDAFAAQDSRVTVIHQKNAGVSVARNVGMNAATGEWICFLDADDTILPQLLERTTAVGRDSGAQLVLFDPYVYEGDRITVDSMPFFTESTLISRKDITPEMLRFMAGTVWRVLYSRQLLQDNGLRFEVTLPLSEDRLFNIEAMGCCESLYYLREPLYNYMILSNSSVRKYRANLLEVVMNTHERFSRILEALWGKEYCPIYEKINLVDGSLLCVYSTFAPESALTWKERYQKIREIVNKPEIHGAYDRLEKRTMRQKLVWKKRVLLLCLTAWVWNTWHKFKK